jgi:hypothetical protein
MVGGGREREKSSQRLGRDEYLLTFLTHRTLVYLEGDASMSQYTDSEGKPRSALNLVQREFLYPSHFFFLLRRLVQEYKLTSTPHRKTRSPLTQEADPVNSLLHIFSQIPTPNIHSPLYPNGQISLS